MSLKNSKETIGNRTRDLPGCSTVSSTLRHRAPLTNVCIYVIYNSVCQAEAVVLPVAVTVHTLLKNVKQIFRHVQYVQVLRNILRPELLAKIQERILQVARWRSWLKNCTTNRKVRESLEFFIEKILPGALRPCGRLGVLRGLSNAKITAAGV
jgi:hypothetical protein